MFENPASRFSPVAAIRRDPFPIRASIKVDGPRDAARYMDRTKRWIAILPAMALAACGTDEGAEAEKRYEMVKRNGTKGELCAAGREVADTYLRAGDEKNYEYWNLMSRVECRSAELTSPDDPATETEMHRNAKADTEAAVQKMDEAARQAIEEFEDEGIGSTPAADEPEPE